MSSPQTSTWEREVHHRIRGAGLRFQSDKPLISGTRSNGQVNFSTPDLYFAAQRVAVFLDGCYWHGCPEHFRHSHMDRQERDRKASAGIAERDVHVLRIWEHEGAEAATRRILDILRSRPRFTETEHRIPDTLWHAAKARAAERGESVSAVVRRALERYVRGSG
jgi:DNA mismatch endonuclease (patch repair protein)